MNAQANIRSTRRKDISTSAIQQLYLSGLTSREVGKQLGIDHSMVLRRLARAGVNSSRKPRDYSPFKRLWDKNWLYHQYSELKKTSKEIAEIIGCSQGYALECIRALGIKKIRRSGAQIYNYNGREERLKCKDCGVPIWREKGRCTKCWRKFNRGENHHNHLDPSLRKVDESETWRKRVEFKEWRQSVFKRDNWTCLKCRVRGGVLHPHHKDSFHWCKERRFDVSNGATLCMSCHSIFHNLFGQHDNTEDQFNEFMNRNDISKITG